MRRAEDGVQRDRIKKKIVTEKEIERQRGESRGIKKR